MDDYEVIPQGAIDYLLENPSTAQVFDQAFGAGRAQRVLQENSSIPEAPEPSDSPEMSLLERTWDATGQAVSYGVQESFNETVDAAESFDIWLSQHLDRLVGASRVSLRDEDGNLQFRFQTFEESRNERDFFGGTVGERGDALEINAIDQPETLVGNFVAPIAQFAAGFAGAQKLTRLGGLRGMFVNGAIADAVVFNPNDPNLTRTLEEWGINTGVMEVLATDPDDPEYINRARNAVEGALAGSLVEALAWGVRATRARLSGADEEAISAAIRGQEDALAVVDEALANAAREVQADAQQTIEFADEIIAPLFSDSADDFLDQLGAARTRELDEANAPIDARDLPDVQVDAENAVVVRQGTPDGEPTVVSRVDPETPASVPRNRIYVTEAEVENIRLQTRLADGVTNADLARGTSYRSLRTQENYEGILQQIAAVRAVYARQFDEIKGGNVQSMRKVQLDMARRVRTLSIIHGKDPKELIKRFATLNNGDVRNMAAEIAAQEQHIIGLERELKGMADTITDALNGEQVDFRRWGVNNLDELRLAFNANREIGANLLAFNQAARSNVARALNAMKLSKKGSKQLREIVTNPDMFRDIDSAARAVSTATKVDPNASAMRTIEDNMTKFREIADQVNSFRINALLSGPGTQQVNFVSNMVNSFVIPTEQILGAVGKGDVRLARHGIKQLQGIFAGFFEAIPSVLKAGWYDEAILDPFNGKIEQDNFFRAETAVGRFLQLPSRLLMTMDELFKQAQYRGRILADASDLARQQGLRGQDRTDFIRTYIRESFDADTGAALRKDALLQAQRSTFTEPLEPGLGRMLQKAAIDYPLVRFILPFVRTPLNILSQTWQHFPVLGFASKRLRDDFAAGGVRAAQARGRQMLGAALVGMAGYLAASGYITGSGPSDPRIRAAWMANNSPYSFRIVHEDGRVEFISFARLEPLSNVFSIAADAVAIQQDSYGQNAETHPIQALMIAVMENTVNKTFTQGIYDTMLAFVGRPEEQQRALQNMAASFVPNIANQLNGDDLLREARTLTDNVRARTGLYNMVDPRRNILGEPVVRPLPKYNPLGIGVGDIREVDTVLEEVNRVSMITQSISGAPQRTLPGPNRIDLARIPYSENQSIYDRWLELTGTVEINGRTLREELERTFASRQYQNAPDGYLGVTSRGTKSSIIRNIISAYRQAAKADLPELIEIIEAEREGTYDLLVMQQQANRNQNPPRTVRNARQFELFPDMSN
jgi:hypothetical protein